MRRYEQSIPPWESDPLVFTKAAHTLGLPPCFEFQDVISSTLDDTVAIIVAYVTRESYEEEKEKESDECSQQMDPPEHTDVVWCRQTIDNYCGPLALIHAVLNATSDELGE